MIFYLVYYCVSTYFAYLAWKTNDRKRFILYTLISIAIPVALAALRDYSIGIDVEGYYNMHRYWQGATQRSSLADYLSYYGRTGYGEYLFALLIGCIGQFTDNFHLFLGVCHLVIVLGVYIGAYRHRDVVNPAMVLFLFYLLFFSHSLNIMRQYMAMALIFTVLKDLEQGKYLRYCIVVVLAAMIHNTALFAFGAVVIHILLYGCYRIPLRGQMVIPNRRIRSILIVASLQIVVIAFLPGARLLHQLGVLPEKYGFYLYPTGLTPAFIVMGLLVMELVAVYFFQDLMRSRAMMFDFYGVCSVCYLILQELTGIINYGKRIAGYFSLNNLITLCLLACCFKNRKARKLATACILAISLFYWWYVYILRNASQTYPYAFFDFT